LAGNRAAVTVRPAKEDQYDGFVKLIQAEASDYFDRSLRMMGMPVDTFRRLFRVAGWVYGVYEGKRPLGFCWIELRQGVLHIHGLVLAKEHQGHGVGTRVLEVLETEFRGKASAIEIGVYSSNEQARAFFERHGYRVDRTREDLDFHILKKPLPA
jgi:ribosomal protein S18 acetylase RimI-like enzyme